MSMTAPTSTPEPMMESPPPPSIFKKPKSPPPPAFRAESAPSAPPPPTCDCGTSNHSNHGVVEGDPHFFGKHGERFDFHGKNNHNYCVISDTKLQINMHLFQGVHKGSSVDLPKAHEYVSQTTQMIVSYYSTYIRVCIPNVVDFNVTIMKPTFGIHGSGAKYINFQMSKIKVSPVVHGILGQTYQETKQVYVKLYQAHGMTPKQAAKIFLDGSEDDYLTTGIFVTDCKFAKFESQTRFPSKVKRALLLKAKQILSAHEEDDLVSGCAGVGDPTSLCVNLIDNWLN